MLIRVRLSATVFSSSSLPSSFSIMDRLFLNSWLNSCCLSFSINVIKNSCFLGQHLMVPMVCGALLSHLCTSSPPWGCKIKQHHIFLPCFSQVLRTQTMCLWSQSSSVGRCRLERYMDSFFLHRIFHSRVVLGGLILACKPKVSWNTYLRLVWGVMELTELLFL